MFTPSSLVRVLSLAVALAAVLPADGFAQRSGVARDFPVYDNGGLPAIPTIRTRSTSSSTRATGTTTSATSPFTNC